MLNKNWILIPAILSWLLIGCTKMTAAQLALNNVAQGGSDKSDRPACEIQRTEYALDAKLMSFEVTDEGGLNAGFSLISGFLKLLSLDFKATTGKLTVGLSIYDPMVPSVNLTNALGGGRSFNFGASVDAGFENIGAGFDYGHSTPLAALAQDSLNDGFTTLSTNMTTKQAAWKTQVLAIPNKSQYVIPAGSYSNLKLGDKLAIYNVTHVWEGEPCASTYTMAIRTTQMPLAIGRVDQIENNGALLTLICSEQDICDYSAPVEIGAAVEIYKLTDDKRVLSRSLNIRSVTGGSIPYLDGKYVDISPYLKDIINAVAQDYHFIITIQ